MAKLNVLFIASLLFIIACGSLPDVDEKKTEDCKAAQTAGEELSESCKQLLGISSDIANADTGQPDTDAGAEPEVENDTGTDIATNDTADNGNSPEDADVGSDILIEPDADMVEDIADSEDGEVDTPDNLADDGTETADGGDAEDQEDTDKDSDAEPDVLPPLCVSPTDCEDQNPCTDDACGASGCTNLANAATCTDSNACTVDLCEQATCTSKPLVCDDGNACTDDSCESANGCVTVPNSATCTDSDECTSGEVCTKGSCVGGIKKNCDDGNVCTDNGCDTATGCTATVNAASCDDGSKCTASDVCAIKSCTPGKPVSCDDGNICTQDACNPATGCMTTPVADSTPCGQNKACKAGACIDLAPPGMTLISAGSFWMGCFDTFEGDLCKNNPWEKPQHKVTLDAYWIDKYEVAASSYNGCVAAGGCVPVTGCNSAPGKGDHPINCVTWIQADTYCKWAGKRLPTEAEWERSAKGCLNKDCDQATSLFPWGNDDPKCGGFANYVACGIGDTVGVSSLFETSALGVVGLGSNVSEWVNDWYDPQYYGASQNSVNPSGPVSGTKRVFRGGHYKSPLLGLRSAIRSSAEPSVSLATQGFRCAKSVK